MKFSVLFQSLSLLRANANETRVCGMIVCEFSDSSVSGLCENFAIYFRQEAYTFPDRNLIRKLPYELFVVRHAVTMHVTKFQRFTVSVHVNVSEVCL